MSWIGWNLAKMDPNGHILFEQDRMATMPWFQQLSNRERAETMFALEYATNFNHGTEGHNRLNLLAKLAEMLTEQTMRPLFLLDLTSSPSTVGPLSEVDSQEG